MAVLWIDNELACIEHYAIINLDWLDSNSCQMTLASSVFSTPRVCTDICRAQSWVLRRILQVLAPAALVAVVRYGQGKQWRFAEAAAQDDLSAGSFSGGATGPGHQGNWVAQQVLVPVHFTMDVLPNAAVLVAAQSVLMRASGLSTV